MQQTTPCKFITCFNKIRLKLLMNTNASFNMKQILIICRQLLNDVMPMKENILSSHQEAS